MQDKQTIEMEDPCSPTFGLIYQHQELQKRPPMGPPPEIRVTHEDDDEQEKQEGGGRDEEDSDLEQSPSSSDEDYPDTVLFPSIPEILHYNWELRW